MDSLLQSVSFEEELLQAIAPLQARLNRHALYTSIGSLEALRIFMQSHVFAVWDFMSLLKSLQRTLTCVEVPWVPGAGGKSGRLINEIVLGEESDTFEGGATSHFELYLKAMASCGADTSGIDRLVAALRSGATVEQALADVPREAAEFVRSTFGFIATGTPHRIAAAFTFGREDVIPEMFSEFVRGLDAELPGRVALFRYYLERHIEMDGDEHGPMAMEMLRGLCATSQQWAEATEAACQALEARIVLWDGIVARLAAR